MGSMMHLRPLPNMFLVLEHFSEIKATWNLPGRLYYLLSCDGSVYSGIVGTNLDLLSCDGSVYIGI